MGEKKSYDFMWNPELSKVVFDGCLNTYKNQFSKLNGTFFS